MLKIKKSLSEKITFSSKQRGLEQKRYITTPSSKLEDLLEKAREGLVPKKVQIIPSTWEKKPYWSIRWVRPRKGFEDIEKLLSPNEKQVLQNYKEFGSRPINLLLRNGILISGSPTSEEELKQQILTMDKAFQKVPLTSENMFLFRGIRSDTKIYEHLDANIGRIFTDNGFLSTTSNANIAQKFGKLILIKIPKGTKVIPLDFAAGTSSQKEEEILLPRNSRFKVSKENDQIVLELLINEK